MRLEIGKWVNNANIETRKRPTCANRTRCSTRVDYLQCNDVIVGWGVCVSICYDLRSFTLLLEMSNRNPNRGSEVGSATGREHIGIIETDGNIGNAEMVGNINIENIEPSGIFEYVGYDEYVDC